MTMSEPAPILTFNDGPRVSGNSLTIIRKTLVWDDRSYGVVISWPNQISSPRTDFV